MQEQIHKHCWQNCCWKAKHLGPPWFLNVKRRDPTNPADLSNHFLEQLEYESNIYQIAWTGFWIFETLKLETLNTWNFETLKLGDFETLIFYLEWKESPTPKHSESQPYTSPNLGGHEWSWGSNFDGTNSDEQTSCRNITMWREQLNIGHCHDSYQLLTLWNPRLGQLWNSHIMFWTLEMSTEKMNLC